MDLLKKDFFMDLQELYMKMEDIFKKNGKMAFNNEFKTCIISFFSFLKYKI